jgi:hypothetical protein
MSASMHFAVKVGSLHSLSLPSGLIVISRTFGQPRFFLVSWGGMRLSPLRASATNWPIVPAPDDRWIWSSQWNENWQRKPKYSEKICPSATLPTINPTWPDLDSNSGRRGWKPATNRMSYGTALPLLHCFVLIMRAGSSSVAHPNSLRRGGSSCFSFVSFTELSSLICPCL